MKNNTIDVKFSTSNKATDICLSKAKYVTEALGMDLTKQNIDKYYKKSLREYRKTFSKNTKQEVRFLRCNRTNTEIGFYLKTSYQSWDNLSILYVNPDCRGQGHSQTLINLYEMDCRDASVIEISPKYFKKVRTLYEYAGYTETVDDIFCTNYALIKSGSLETVSKAVDADSLSHIYIYESLREIARSCSTRSEFNNEKAQIRELFKVFRNDAHLFCFCQYSIWWSPSADCVVQDFLVELLVFMIGFNDDEVESNIVEIALSYRMPEAAHDGVKTLLELIPEESDYEDFEYIYNYFEKYISDDVLAKISKQYSENF